MHEGGLLALRAPRPRLSKHDDVDVDCALVRLLEPDAPTLVQDLVQSNPHEEYLWERRPHKAAEPGIHGENLAGSLLEQVDPVPVPAEVPDGTRRKLEPRA